MLIAEGAHQVSQTSSRSPRAGRSAQRPFVCEPSLENLTCYAALAEEGKFIKWASRASAACRGCNEEGARQLDDWTDDVLTMEIFGKQRAQVVKYSSPFTSDCRTVSIFLSAQTGLHR